MIGVLIALALSSQPVDPLSSRIAEAEAAAQGLQGLFDGAWVLYADTKKGVLYRLQMTDPPNASGAVLGAWRDPLGRMGSVRITRQTSDEFYLIMDTEPALQLALRPRGRSWTGKLSDGAIVVLTPHLASE